MIGYKVFIYSCGSKYVWITDESKRILKVHHRCPVCNAAKKHVILWCKNCGLKIKTTPRSGIKRKRCPECSRIDQLQKVKANWYKYRAVHNAKRRKKPLKTQEDRNRALAAVVAKQMALRWLYRQMTSNLPPVTLTPVIDKLFKKYLDMVLQRRTHEGIN